MTNKTHQCYLSVLNYIEENIFEMEPAEFISDFEGGMRKAIKICYPNSLLRGCWYHFCCAVSRNINQHGLIMLLRTNPNARMIKGEILSLPLLPQEHFNQGYNHIRNQVIEFGLQADFQAFFNDYFVYWLNEVFLK